MYEPTLFGVFLKAKRELSGLRQDQLAKVIGKTGQYISNIEKGKNNSPPKEQDLEALAKELKLEGLDLAEFREKAAADRGTLPCELIDYIFRCDSLKNLIRYGAENELQDGCWKQIAQTISGGNNNEVK